MDSHKYGWSSYSFPPQLPPSSSKHPHSSASSKYNTVLDFYNTSNNPNKSNIFTKTSLTSKMMSRTPLTVITSGRPWVAYELHQQLEQQYSPYLEAPASSMYTLYSATFQNAYQQYPSEDDTYGGHATCWQNLASYAPLAQPYYELAPLTPVKPEMPGASNDRDPEVKLRIFTFLGIPIEEPVIPQVPEIVVTTTPPATEEVVKAPQDDVKVADKALKASPSLQEKPQKRNHKRSKWTKNTRNTAKNAPTAPRSRPPPPVALPGWGNAFQAIRDDDKEKREKAKVEMERIGEAYRPKMTETYKRGGKKEVEVHGVVAGKAEV